MTTDGVLISRDMLAFLCGDGPLDGHYFGEKPEHERGNFWWRKHLREAEKVALERAGDAATVKECLTTAADAGVTQGDADKKLLAHIVSWVHCPAIMSVDQVEQMIAAHRLQSVAAATAAKDAEIAELAEAVRCIMARCEALEDEAYAGIRTVSGDGRDETHEAGFWRGQKSTAKSIRDHLHDMTRAALSEAREAGDSLAAGDRV